MAYNGNALAQIASTMSQFGSSECQFTESFYSTTDTLAAVLAANYIYDGQQRGLVLNSVVWVQTSLGLALCEVSALEAHGWGVTLLQITSGGGGGGSGGYRIVTTAGAVTVLPTDSTILLKKSPSGASSIILPTSASRNGSSLTVKDLTYDAAANHITWVPAAGETLDGFSASVAAANGVALIDIDGGYKTWSPLTGGGWYSVS